MSGFPAVAPGEPIVVSATAYVTWLRCPEQARGRLAGEYPEDTPQSFRGALAHRVFARHLVDGPLAPDDFGLTCREEIGRALNPKLGPLGLNRPSRLEAVVREVGELYERFKRFSTEGFSGAEVTLHHEATPGVTLRGVVDAVFDAAGGVRLVDWKTGALGAAEPQLDFYAMVWWLERRELPVLVEAASVVTGERFERSPSLDDVDETAHRVARLVSDVRMAFSRDDGLEAVGGPWCRYCPLLAGCAEGSAAMRVVG